MSLKCINHPDAVTEVLCSECKKGICKKCRIPKDHMYLCVECLKAFDKKMKRDTALESRLITIGSLSLILGVVFFLWGILTKLNLWIPPTRYNILGEHEPHAFMIFGVGSFLAGIGIFKLFTLSRLFQILLSLCGILGIMTLHPIAILSSLIHIYILTVLLHPKAGEVFSPAYKDLISEEELKAGALSFYHALKLPVFILFGFIGTFLVIVSFILLFALQPTYYAPTGVYFLNEAGMKVLESELKNGEVYYVGFNYEHQKVYPNPLHFQMFVDGRLHQKGTLTPPPDQGNTTCDIGKKWTAYSGKHEIKVVLYQGQSSIQHRAALFNLDFEVGAR